MDNYVKIEDGDEKYWNDEDSDGDLKRRKEAELLIEDHLSANLIDNLIVYNEETKLKLQGIGVTKTIHVIPTFYF